MESDVSLKCWNNNKKQGTTEQVFFTDDPASVFFINKCYHVFTRDCSAPLAMPHILKEKTEHIYEVQQPLCKAHAVQGIANMVCVCVYVMTDLWPWHWAWKCLFPMHLCFACRQFVDGLLRPNLFRTGLKISIAQALAHHNSHGSNPGSIR